MANTDKPFGLRAVRHLSGGCVQTNEYTIAAAYATNLYSGDPVQLVAGGTIEICVAAQADCMGVFSGCSYVNAAGEQVFSKYWPTGTVATDIPSMTACKLGVQESVVFTGAVPYSLVPAYIALADIEAHWLTQDSVDKTSLGIATLETMGAGKTIISAANENTHGPGVLKTLLLPWASWV